MKMRGGAFLRFSALLSLSSGLTNAYAAPSPPESSSSSSKGDGGASTAGPSSREERETTAAQAASEFELGVSLYSEARFEAAARAFLRADLLVQSADALANALTAARKAGAHLLITSAAERILERGGVDPNLVADARAALTEAARHLARVKLSCQPAPCRLLLDSVGIADGARYVTPGSHRLLAEFGSGSRRELLATLQAGTTYEFVLEPPEGKAPIERAPDAQERGASTSEIIFYAGLGSTLVLAGVTTWSGVDALSFHNSIGDNPTDAERETHGNKITRTDILLGASIGAGVLTLAWALFGVEWGRESPPPLEASFGPHGAFLSARGVLP